MIDLDFFCWRNPTKDVAGDDRLLVADADDGDVNLMWATAQEAIDWRDAVLTERDLDCVHCGIPIEFHENTWWHAEECPPETACYEGDRGATPEQRPAELDWLLVHYTGLIVGPFANPLVNTLVAEFDKCLAEKDRRMFLKRGVELHTKLGRVHGDNSLTTADRRLLSELKERLLVEVFGIELK